MAEAPGLRAGSRAGTCLSIRRPASLASGEAVRARAADDRADPGAGGEAHAAGLQQRDEQFIARLQAFVEPLPAPQRPAGYLRFIGAWSQERDFQGCLFINAAAEYPDLAHAIHLQAARHKAGLRQWLLGLCEQAALPDAPAVAARLFLLGEGLTVGAQVQGFDAQLLEAACAQLAA